MKGEIVKSCLLSLASPSASSSLILSWPTSIDQYTTMPHALDQVTVDAPTEGRTCTAVHEELVRGDEFELAWHAAKVAELLDDGRALSIIEKNFLRAIVTPENVMHRMDARSGSSFFHQQQHLNNPEYVSQVVCEPAIYDAGPIQLQLALW
jgi:hypothetical protein